MNLDKRNKENKIIYNKKKKLKKGVIKQDQK